MKTILKSYFFYTKQQRKGILYLLIIIIVLQLVYFFTHNTSQDVFKKNGELFKYEAKIDSLQVLEIKAQTSKIYPFNPNFITDYKGAFLGMRNEEIDKLLTYRKQGGWVNSSSEFQKVTGVSDSLLDKITPYFRFPKTAKKITYNHKAKAVVSNKKIQKKDLNKVTSKELQKVKGVGVVLSKRIVKYRNLLPEGYTSNEQLNNVYGLKPDVVLNICKYFTVKTSPEINKIDVNKATVNQLLTVRYIDYEIAHNIIKYRKLHKGFKTLDELTKVNDFPSSKINIIKLSLCIR